MPRKGENIRKRKDGRWEGRYIVGYENRKNRTKYASVYGKTYEETKKKLTEARYKANHGLEFITGKNLYFSAALQEWFRRQQLHLKPSSVGKYRGLLENHILPELGHWKMRELDEEVFSRFLQTQQVRGNRNTGGALSVSTLSAMVYILNATVKYAADRHWMSPVTLRLSYRAKAVGAVHILAPGEEEKLERYLSQNSSCRNFGIMLSLYCGLRLGEVCALRWEDLGRDGLLRVRRTVQRLADPHEPGKTRLHVGPPKSSSSFRSIPIPAFLQTLGEELARGQPPESYILTGSATRPLEPRTLQYHFTQTLSAAGVDKTNYHTLRHTFATNCVALGFDTKTLSEILGHADVGITMNRYVHPSLQQKKRHMDSWDAIKGPIYGQTP